MSGLTEFLLARIAEDENRARDAEVMRWIADGADWSPGRVLAECAAKRRIVEMHPVEHRYCDGCGMETQHPEGCLNLRVLASVYSDHPDYSPDWRSD